MTHESNLSTHSWAVTRSCMDICKSILVRRRITVEDGGEWYPIKSQNRRIAPAISGLTQLCMLCGILDSRHTLR